MPGSFSPWRQHAVSLIPTRKPCGSRAVTSFLGALQLPNSRSNSSRTHCPHRQQTYIPHLQPRSSSPRNIRRYHSKSQPSPNPPADRFTPEQSAILSAALKYVPEHGFSTKSVIIGARELGYLDVSLQLFSRGAELELVLYWLATRRGLLKEMVESGEIFGEKDVAAESFPPAEVDRRVKTLIVERLKMNKEIINHWQDALAVMSLPSGVSPALCELYDLSSDILYLANDCSVDTSWYTRRLAVATIYASADIHMTEDTSPDFRSTFKFVDRRIHDVNTVMDTTSDVKQYLGYIAGSIVNVGRSWGMKV
ncbi:Ubiquinone biosynthesis protein coq9, mitochondrial [Ophidiomyces ophidiicola]|nr:Ubiquinone biosynthesis protein coq9, mitochondrial [Ophidiomyces ophidiicola]